MKPCHTQRSRQTRYPAAALLAVHARVVLLACLMLIGAPCAFAAAPVAHTVSVDGHPLRVWEKRAEQHAAAPNTVMLLVHGRTWSARPDFDLQVEGEDLSLMSGLIDLGIRPYAVDLRGYGETPRDASGWLTPRRAAADVIAVLQWMRARHPHSPPPYLFGWSYGSMVAQLVAQQRPELISGLLLFGYPVRPGIDQDPPEAAGAPPRVANAAEAAASDFILPGAISRKAIDSFVQQALTADPVRTDWRELAQWRALDGTKVHSRTLLLEGFHDPLALDEEQARLFTAIASGDKVWVVIPGGDHAAFMETPRAYFLRQIGAFVN